MKLNDKHSSKNQSDAMKCNIALRKIANFCDSYKSEDINELCSTLMAALIGQKYSDYSSRTKERLLDYFEAMEEVLPALHDLHNHLISVNKKTGEQVTYEQQIAYRRLIVSQESEN